MDNLDKILDSLETEVNDGIDLTKRLANKSFGLFKNPIFLLTFFTVLFTIIGYKLYHYFKKQDDTTCQNFKKEKECPGYCVWDTGDESCSAPLKSGNACPDYWSTTVDAANEGVVFCSPPKSLKIYSNDKKKMVDIPDTCYTDKTKKQLKIINGKLADGRGKCDWMNKCGPWEGQGIGKFGCQQDTAKENPFKSSWIK